MNSTGLLQTFLSMFIMYLPTVIICLVAGIVILARWSQAPGASLWALLGFGLALVLCFAMPIGQTLVQHWVMQDGQHEARVWAFSVLSIAGSLLHGVVYVLLLVAIYAGRSKPAGVSASLNGR
jgi:hypothetical protein